MNKFVKSEYDQFQQKNVVKLKENLEMETKNSNLMVITPEIGFRYLSFNDNETVFVMDLKVTSRSGLGMNKGQMMIILDDKRLVLDPHESFSDPYLDSFHVESDYYKIEQSDLKAICDAKAVSIRVTNGDGYFEIASIDKFIWGARVMYNALFDKTLYVKEILEVSNKRDQEAYVQKHKTGLVWAWILCSITIIIGFFTAWWVVVIGVAVIAFVQYRYNVKKSEILNSTQIE